MGDDEAGTRAEINHVALFVDDIATTYTVPAFAIGGTDIELATSQAWNGQLVQIAQAV